jgi:serine/threonine protein kinase
VHEGVPLAGQVSKLKALATAREVSGAMEYLHSQNVLHGDLNGNNILLAGAHAAPGAADQRGFTAKVADFGLSRLLSPGGCVVAVCWEAGGANMLGLLWGNL